MRNTIILLTLACAAAMAWAETVYTTRKSNYVREGPGSYYGLLAVVPENTALVVVGKSGSWLKVKVPKQREGWLAENCIAKAKGQGMRTVSLENVWASPKASRAGISAAIKGFAEKHGNTTPGNVDQVMKNSARKFTASEFAEFKKAVDKFRPEAGPPVTIKDLELGTAAYDAGIPEQEVGVGISARLVEKGLVTDPQLNAYVNMICAVIAENSEAYDWDFSVFIVQEKTVNGFAVPGGYIFLTLGALQMCSDESELAGMIAHEMAHVIRKHGLQEMSKRIANIRSDAAFAELEAEIGQKSEVETDLENMMQEMYEKIVSPRLLSYELEADRVAAVLLSASGYDPFGLVRMAARVASIPREKPELFDVTYMASDDLGERAGKIEAFMKERFPDANGARLKDRFLAQTAALR